MHQQFWLIKNAKKIQRKFNAKEDENIVASDNELDTKLELFKSINESSNSLIGIVDKYKDGLHQLSVETSSLGSFLRDCGKNSTSSKEIMCSSGKVICYVSTQVFSAMSSLNRTFQELNTFKLAVHDTRDTILAMEKERTEYRSSLSLMKTCSTDIDPDSGRGLEKYRQSQKYVKFSKQKFDKMSLACLHKVDLLAAARCNLFSYSLATYQSNWLTLLQKNQEILEAHIKVIDKEPRKHNFGILKELCQDDEEVDQENKEDAAKLEVNDQDQALFFGDEFSDLQPAEKPLQEVSLTDEASVNAKESVVEGCLIDYESFADFMSSPNLLMPSQLLMSDFNNESLMDSTLMELTGATSQPSNKDNTDLTQNPSKKTNDVSKWFSLFSDLDPLNQNQEHENATKNLHAA